MGWQTGTTIADFFCLSFSLSKDTQAGMKRGLEEMSAEMSGPKKTKTISNGEGSAELHGEQWTKVEKKKKKKIRNAESKLDVCIIS